MVAGRYRITGVLGRGGFGAVYAAEHTGTLQPIAIKMLTASGDEESEANQRFYREAQITAALSSPNTVRVFDVGRADNGPLFLAMELLKGPTLEQVLKQLGKAKRVMSERQAVDVGLGILNSLAEAHAAGLVHRDLKPANIMLADVAGGDPVIKVLDFGCSTTQDSELTQEGTVLGTPGYMSPEQCRGEAVDARSDLYALGVMLYRCVTGRLPFKSDQPLTLIYKHAHEPVPDPREVSVHQVSGVMASMLLRVLAKSPDERYESAQAMRDELRRFAADVVAEPRHAEGTHTRIQRRGGSMRPLSGLLRIARGEATDEAAVDPAAPTDSAAVTESEAGAATVAYDGKERARAVARLGASGAVEGAAAAGTDVAEAAAISPAEPGGPQSERSSAASAALHAEDLDAPGETSERRPAWLVVLLALLLLGGAIGTGVMLGGGDSGETTTERGPATAGSQGATGGTAGSGPAAGGLPAAARPAAQAALPKPPGKAPGKPPGKAPSPAATSDAAAGAVASASGDAATTDAGSAAGPGPDADPAPRSWVARAKAERDPKKRVALLERGLRDDPDAAEATRALAAAKAALARARARARAAEAAAERARREAAKPAPAADRPRLKGVLIED